MPYVCPILPELQANIANDHTCMSVLLKPRCKTRNTPAIEFLSCSVRTRGTGPQWCSSAVCCPGWKTPQTRTFGFLSYSVRTRGGRIVLRISVIYPNCCRITLLSTCWCAPRITNTRCTRCMGHARPSRAFARVKQFQAESSYGLSYFKPNICRG